MMMFSYQRFHSEGAARPENRSGHVPTILRSSRNGFLRLFRITLPLTMLMLLLTIHSASACPACKEAVAEQSSSGLAEGLSYSVIGMVSMPFLLFASVAVIIVRSYIRRTRLAQDISQLN